jgi:hypothetical protein
MQCRFSVVIAVCLIFIVIINTIIVTTSSSKNKKNILGLFQKSRRRKCQMSLQNPIGGDGGKEARVSSI